MSTCSTVSRGLDEPISGTAATPRTWLLLEQPGPWGAKALTSSHLDPALGRALEAAAKSTDVRIALIRRPGRHADRGTPTPRQVYAAHTMPGNTWLQPATAGDPRTLLELDFAALGRGEQDSFDSVLGGQPHAGDPLALVCTNGKRDRCCALLGRPLAAALAATACEYAADTLSVVRTDGAAPCWQVTIAHADGRRWLVEVAQGASLPPRPESCGTSVLGSPARMEVLAVHELRTTALAS